MNYPFYPYPMPFTPAIEESSEGNQWPVFVNPLDPYQQYQFYPPSSFLQSWINPFMHPAPQPQPPACINDLSVLPLNPEPTTEHDNTNNLFVLPETFATVFEQQNATSNAAYINDLIVLADPSSPDNENTVHNRLPEPDQVTAFPEFSEFPPDPINYESKSAKSVKKRSFFSDSQTRALATLYTVTQFLHKRERKELAGVIGVTENQIRIWLQNRRSKTSKLEGVLCAKSGKIEYEEKANLGIQVAASEFRKKSAQERGNSRFNPY